MLVRYRRNAYLDARIARLHDCILDTAPAPYLRTLLARVYSHKDGAPNYAALTKYAIDTLATRFADLTSGAIAAAAEAYEREMGGAEEHAMTYSAAYEAQLMSIGAALMDYLPIDYPLIIDRSSRQGKLNRMFLLFFVVEAVANMCE